jgi:hypothetical protein
VPRTGVPATEPRTGEPRTGEPRTAEPRTGVPATNEPTTTERDAAGSGTPRRTGAVPGGDQPDGEAGGSTGERPRNL